MKAQVVVAVSIRAGSITTGGGLLATTLGDSLGGGEAVLTETVVDLALLRANCLFVPLS